MKHSILENQAGEFNYGFSHISKHGMVKDHIGMKKRIDFLSIFLVEGKYAMAETVSGLGHDVQGAC